MSVLFRELNSPDVRVGEHIYILYSPRALYPDVIVTRHPIREPAPVAVGTAMDQIAVAEVEEKLDTRNNSE